MSVCNHVHVVRLSAHVASSSCRQPVRVATSQTEAKKPNTAASFHNKPATSLPFLRSLFHFLHPRPTLLHPSTHTFIFSAAVYSCTHSHISPRPDFSQRYSMLNYRREYMVLPYMTQPSTQLPSLAYGYLLGTLSKSVI